MTGSPVFQPSRVPMDRLSADLDVRGPGEPPSGRPGARPEAENPPGRRRRERRRRVYIEVFGCQMNKLDAELMLDVLLAEGYTLTDRLDEAGVALYVTCSVRQHAENRVLSKLGRLKSRKRRDRDFVVGLLGCMAQNQPEAIRRRHPHIDVICGTAEFLRLPELIDQARTAGPVVAVDLEKNLAYTRTRNLGSRSFQAFISVMRGCDMACSFCIVPRTRGPEVSKPIREIVEEARALADSGVREVTLLGQTVNSYGKSLASGRRIGLQHLLHELNKISGLDRIRFITSHPSFMNDDLVDAMGSLEKVCGYLHLPVQSGDDAVLRRMRRGYTVDHYRRVVSRCRERIPGFRLATDFIVGFPGETDEQFEASCRLLEEMEYQNSFVFKYSPRPETAASALADDVPEGVKQERNQRLLEIQKEVSTRVYRRSIGNVEEVLVEGPSRSEPSRFTGRNAAHQIVVFPVTGDAVPGGVEASALVGKILPVRIEEATHLTLQGSLLSGEERGSLAPAPVAAPPGASCDSGSEGGAFVPIEGIGLLAPRPGNGP